ncbi:MAG: hypothetical protein AAB891_02360, partial [Patescibacteria group bacterium]
TFRAARNRPQPRANGRAHLEHSSLCATLLSFLKESRRTRSRPPIKGSENFLMNGLTTTLVALAMPNKPTEETGSRRKMQAVWCANSSAFLAS